MESIRFREELLWRVFVWPLGLKWTLFLLEKVVAGGGGITWTEGTF